MSKFEEDYEIPQILGAIDGSHIRIIAPSENHEDYFNRKRYHSVNLQAIVDSSLLFLHVSVGYPGSIHDSRVLQLSGIYDYAENQDILSSPSLFINGVETRPLLVGDSAYTLRTWLIKPYANRANGFSLQCRKLSAARSVVERAFGKMKTRWRILNKKNEQRLNSICRTVLATCVLHNLCITLV